MAYKVDSFDNDVFIEDIVIYRPNSIILIFNKQGIRVAYKPKNYDIKNEGLSSFHFSNPKIDYFVYPLMFVANLLKVLGIFLYFCFKYRVNTIIVENTFAAAIVGILRKIGLVKKMLYIPGDWLAGNVVRMGIWSHLGNNIIFPVFDYVACKFSDITLNCTLQIIEERNKFWGKSASNKDVLFVNRLKIKQDMSNVLKNKIVFLGLLRDDSGVNFVVSSLPKIRKSVPVSLKMIGNKSHQELFIKKLAISNGVEKNIEFMGFTEKEKFKEALKDCFCGLNLVTSKESHTSKTIPAKICDYLQYLIPVVVTKNIGPMAKIIEINKLGVVIDPTKENISRAILHVYKNQVQYRNNIIKYLHSLEKEESIVKYI
ncbi:hypothetical protein COT44_04870 [Candidatus Shapirobacteria bacterium CG08_land_8_20_14_0_20_39_18]|uniref:Glycosyl transferase family 1 domain-containing protein n=1 Tax=Candidatus Shapirobacteria bacterium CG08_land_8_20_14_0_20_39_18 TaxID=1974883 RepID=A0A2M6XC25_9BACT|nr:MAG: hypothetical protein COT44_04870 [Candidatus Shapirobacteria bacterium CG08_land_8_20_14_0_20_39_18]PIY65384.1 MAG: hypothetical protein COY91_03160 [Candidatus Shapirobacteria bacterium CG_4_10_14_0_8_um_filter_39_15]PJE68593.1 MAG: hypothetical protein COU94_01300 [Candidatus Shapirobacteria bacterium CG10_big_fil_rev_8_21_14_0_10_38_8]